MLQPTYPIAKKKSSASVLFLRNCFKVRLIWRVWPYQTGEWSPEYSSSAPICWRPFPRVSRKESFQVILHRIAVGFEAPHSVLAWKQCRPDTRQGKFGRFLRYIYSLLNALSLEDLGLYRWLTTLEVLWTPTLGTLVDDDYSSFSTIFKWWTTNHEYFPCIFHHKNLIRFSGVVK